MLFKPTQNLQKRPFKGQRILDWRKVSTFCSETNNNSETFRLIIAVLIHFYMTLSKFYSDIYKITSNLIHVYFNISVERCPFVLWFDSNMNRPNQLTRCCTQLKPFGKETFSYMNFRIIQKSMPHYNSKTIRKEF